VLAALPTDPSPCDNYPQAASREHALEEENAKLKYQVLHLKRAAAVQ